MKDNTATNVRTLVLIIALINQALVMFKLNPLPFSEEEMYQFFTLLTTVGASLWAWWKDNPYTKTAKQAHAYKKQIRKAKKDVPQVEIDIDGQEIYPVGERMN